MISNTLIIQLTFQFTSIPDSKFFMPSGLTY